MEVASLFSGAGGLDAGLVQAGHKIVWANDIDRDSVETYKLNVGRDIELADICDIHSNDIPSVDVLVGGFPCQGFSQANLLRFEGDERNRLYREFRRIVRDKQPRYFIAENVRGILSLAGGAAIQKIEQDFEEAGYRIQKKLFNVADYGVPQIRQRVIIVGTRNDLPESEDYKYPTPTHSKALGERAPWKSISAALAGVPEPDGPHNLLNHICSQYKVTNRNFTGHRRTDPDKPSPTILARGNGGGGVCAIQHPLNHRRMSVREQALVQTFPIDFEFVGRLNSCYRQVGNAVPVLFGQRLGLQLKEQNKSTAGAKCA